MDEIKSALYGGNVRDADLVRADWDKIYQAMYGRIGTALAAGETVVHDTGNFTRHERDSVRQIAEGLGIQAVTVFMGTPELVARERLVANRKAPVRFNVTDQEFQEAADEMEVPDESEPHFVYRPGTPVDAWVASHFGPEGGPS